MRQLEGNSNISNGDANSAPSQNRYTTTKQKLENYNLKNVVQLPEGEDTNEWLAVNAFDFFRQVGMLYGTIADYCNDKTCPTMTAGPNHEYQWIDVEGSRAPIRYNAKEYINHLINWVEERLNDEELFPINCETNFPTTFLQECKVIFKRLFRVYAHVYHKHYNNVKYLEVEPHMNTSFKHFIYFVQEFDLIEQRELAPLKEIIANLTTATCK